MLCYLLPPDEQIASLTYDLDMLLEAVIDRERTDAIEYRSPDELSNRNMDYQAQCRIVQQIYDFARDWDNLPPEMKGT